jgi:oligoendopeptidase F
MSVPAKSSRSESKRIILAALALLLSVAHPAIARAGAAVAVAPVAEKYHWNLAQIYMDEAAWKRDFEVLQGFQGRIGKYRGTLSDSAARLLEALAVRDRLNLLGHRLQSWAEKRVQEDGRDPARQLLVEQLSQVMRGLDSEQAFIESEILAMVPQRIQGYLASESGLRDYKPYLENLLRVCNTRLHPEAESVLAQAQGVLDASQDIFHAIKKDVTFEPVRDARGQIVPLKENYLDLADSPDARVRLDAHLSRLRGYEAHIQGLSAALAAEMKRDLFLANVRRAGSCLELALLDEAVPTEVFRNFIATVKANAGSLQRWMNIRQRLLVVESLQRADLYMPLPIPGVPQRTYEYDEAVQLAEQALAPHGKAYMHLMRTALNQGWVDVFPAPGKDAWLGSSTGVYGVHPYVLLNWDKSLFSLKTLVHELGHAIHQHYMSQDEPFLYQNFWFCSSEVASTCNEILLKERLMARARDKGSKLSLLADEIERMTHLFFGLGLLSEYELLVHTQAEKGGDLSPEWLKKTYRDLAQTYYGPSVAMGPMDDIQGILDLLDNHWGTCYVRYVYALGYSASQDFARRLLAREPKIQATYRRFLGRARAHYPIAALQEAGIDFMTPGPFAASMRDFSDKIDLFERLLKQVQ